MNFSENILILVFIFFSLGFILLFYLYIKKHIKMLNLENKFILSRNKDVGLSPISKISFYDALHSQKMLNAIQESALEKLNKELRNSFPGQSLSKSAQLVDSVRILKDKSIVMTLSNKGKKLLKSGKAEIIFHKDTGKLLPAIRDSQSKKFIENMKGAPANSISKLSKISNLIVNTAHIISSADMAKKINILDKKTDYLIEGRRIDKIGDLEANYRLAQQILSKNIINTEEYGSLLEIHKDLMRLRSIWRREIEYKLSNINDPKNRNFFSRKWGILDYTKSTNKNIYNAISTFKFELALIDFTIFFDVLIGEKLSLYYYLNDDLKFLSHTKKLLKSRQQFLTGENNEYAVDEYLAFFDKLEDRVKCFLPKENKNNNNEYSDYELIEKEMAYNRST